MILICSIEGASHHTLTGGPGALIKDDRFYLWFFGSQQNNFAYVYFGLATADYTSPKNYISLIL